jgi:hypothetical protein
MTMGNMNATGRYQEYVAMGNLGRKEDVDFLMLVLVENDDFSTSRLVDFALSLVKSREGRETMKGYLFNGLQIQRNYAALYFKRLGFISLLDEAVAQGKIDTVQAYAQ